MRDPDDRRRAGLALAERVADTLLRSAISSTLGSTWLELSPDGTGRIQIRPMDGSLYRGTSGVALFFGELYRVTRREVYKSASEGAITAAQRWARRGDPAIVRGGFYGGVDGVGVVAQLLRRRVGIDVGPPPMSTSVEATALDLLGGLSGRAVAFTLAGSLGGDPALLARAGDQCDELVRRAERADGLARWAADVPATQALTGMAHGQAGIEYALALGDRALGRPALLEAARDAMRAEDLDFSPRRRNWEDFRAISQAPGASEPRYVMAWCHGAPGIAIGRLMLVERGVPGAGELVHAALDATREELSRIVEAEAADLSLCHGVAGLADVLLHASHALDRPQDRPALDGALDYLAERTSTTSEPAASLGASLMLGLAGVGLFGLRLADDDVPTPLAPATFLQS